MSNRTARLAINIINYFVVTTVIISNSILPGRTEVQDNPAIKDGNPCIEEICINDEVKNLINIKWKKVTVANVNYSLPFKVVGDPNATNTFIRYLNVGSIDGIGLKALSKIKGFCDNPMGSVTSLGGSYINKKGQPVLVYFSAVPSADGKSQKFIATGINKVIDRASVTPEQEQDLAAQAQEKYKSYYQKPFSGHYPNVNLSTVSGSPVLRIESQFGKLNLPDGVPINPSKFQYFPGCGGDRKIKL
jgi:hypothetical protein